MIKSPKKEQKDPENKVSVPVDTINEQIVVAAALVDASIRDQYVLKESADRFADDDHARIWDGMRTVLQRGKGFDIQQLHAEISSTVKLDYLRQLMERYPKPPVDMARHVSQLRWDHSRKRAAEDSIPAFLRLLKDPTSSPTAVAQAAERVAKSLHHSGDRSFILNPNLILARQKDRLRRRRSGEAVYPYGIAALDFFPDGKPRMIPGAAPGKVTLITGESGSGKSVLQGIIALQQARMGRRVMYGSYEMGEDDTIDMLTTMSFNIPPPGVDELEEQDFVPTRSLVSTGGIPESMDDTFQERSAKIMEWVKFVNPPFHEEPGRRFTNEEALNEIHRQVAEAGCEVCVFDLWERCFPDNSDPGEERRALFTQQQIHKKTNTHGFLVCQQRIKGDVRKGDKRPRRETIMGSSAWTEIADAIIGAYRPAHAKNIPDDTMELLVLKQRFGKWPLAIVHTWDGDRMTLTNGRDVDYEFIGDDKQALF